MRELRNYAIEKIKRGVLAIILIGSLARGDYTAFSDADLVVIVRDDRRRPIDRLTEYIDPTLSIDLEPRVYTYNEILRMACRKDKLIEEIIEYGILLAGKRSIIEEIKKYYEKCRDKS
ncbi:MAG: DNA polymerase III subunit beta [Desulfurococcales archaeon ex4484_58]|nr:MAG: DNA polymerase III subunit beta [Desulfurococcales archaeon ex4484_58]